MTKRMKMLIAVLEIEYDAEKEIRYTEFADEFHIYFRPRKTIDSFSLNIVCDDNKVLGYSFPSEQYLVNDLKSANHVIECIEKFKKKYQEKANHVEKILHMSDEELEQYLKEHIDELLDKDYIN